MVLPVPLTPTIISTAGAPLSRLVMVERAVHVHRRSAGPASSSSVRSSPRTPSTCLRTPSTLTLALLAARSTICRCRGPDAHVREPIRTSSISSQVSSSSRSRDSTAEQATEPTDVLGPRQPVAQPHQPPGGRRRASVEQFRGRPYWSGPRRTRPTPDRPQSGSSATAAPDSCRTASRAAARRRRRALPAGSRPPGVGLAPAAPPVRADQQQPAQLEPQRPGRRTTDQDQ